MRKNHLFSIIIRYNIFKSNKTKVVPGEQQNNLRRTRNETQDLFIVNVIINRFTVCCAGNTGSRR